MGRPTAKTVGGSRRKLAPIVLSVAGALGLAACSSSTGTNASTSGSSGTGAHFLKAPLKIALLWSIQGEDSASADYYNQGGVMAINQINKAGGVGGEKIQTVRYESSPLDPQNVITNFLNAVDYDPAFIVGLPAPDAEAASSDVTKAGIPTFSITQDQNLNLGASAGSPWLWTTTTNDGLQAAAAARFVVNDLHAKSVGLLHTNESFGDTGSGIQTTVLGKLGAKIVADESYAVDATDLTDDVLAVKSADATIDWGYPNPVGVQLNQFIQNGIDQPTITGGAASYVVQGKLASAAALKKLYSIDVCNPIGNNSPRVVAWRKDFQALYGYVPTASSAESYDAVNLAVAAIEKAKSISPDAIKKALGSLTYTDGICSSDYHSDGAHNFEHLITVLSWASGTAQTIDNLTTANENAGQPDPAG